mmetsp:Transcript_8640/g.13126  ORF Transcript_8640/g.13126 Transcript_8640/m.13126 type:complete len:245 (-) Transcript_8640:71-805(-)
MSTSSTLVISGLPSDIQAREFSAFFRFANGFVAAVLSPTPSSKGAMGYAKFDKSENALRVLQFLVNQPYCSGFASTTLTVAISPVDLDDRQIAQQQAQAQAASASAGSTGGDQSGSRQYPSSSGARPGYPPMNPMMYQQMMYQQAGMMQSGYPMNRMAKRPRSDPTTVYVAGIPHTMSESTLHGLFSPFGTIVRIDGPRDGKQANRGKYAFIHYQTKEEADTAMQRMNGHQLEEGTTLTVQPRG